jgi:cysteinyl-tRNA synthetase
MFQPRRLQVYNTLSHQKEDFIPLLEEGKADVVGMYSCGPTVYYSPSIGNYRAFFTADLIRNTLVYICGYPVKAVMNMTDVGHLTSDGDTGDDKMEKGAKREGTSVWEIARKYESEFLTGLKKLHIDRFDVMPKATEHVTQQIGLIQTLEKKGYTYEVL